MKIQKLSYKRILAGILAVALCFPMQTFATETEIKKQKQETQKQLDEINSKMKQIESQRNAVLSEIDSLDSELVDLMLNLELLEGDLEQKEAEMAALLFFLFHIHNSAAKHIKSLIPCFVRIPISVIKSTHNHLSIFRYFFPIIVIKYPIHLSRLLSQTFVLLRS